MRRYVQNGTVDTFALWSAYDMGYVTGHLAVLIAQGKLKPAPGVTFTAGTLGERTLRDNNIVIAGKPLVFTKDNIDEYQF
jgi:rhamnose transport system substrate-binding protein